MPLVGACVLPHGCFTLDPDQEQRDYFYKQDALALQSGMKKTCEWIIEPDVIFVSTPHGLSSQENYLVYLNET